MKEVFGRIEGRVTKDWNLVDRSGSSVHTLDLMIRGLLVLGTLAKEGNRRIGRHHRIEQPKKA